MSRDLKGFKHATALGDFSECRVMSEFMRAGFAVLRPFGTNVYDLVAQRGAQFLRIQVKHASLVNGALQCRLVAGLGSAKSPYRDYTKDEVDLFAVYCIELDEVYILPVGIRFIYLRISEPKNNQNKAVHFAKDYEFSKWLKNFGSTKQKQ